MGEDVHGKIKLMRIANLVKKWYDLIRGRIYIFFPTFLVLRVCTCIKVGVFFFFLGKVPKNNS